ncbi:hypothetical protein B0T24DRAFT_75713 [Lasiosphaeria ovina]|uniref:Secreted protein n=1 Tax=Lasiosphaeria ovina TaxID=92902 RepID=A0AAE0NMF1_9PEZI|nr:hypothetical protein B0T24DRAFT_75713 [Lasiosphaeria ovina]
MSGLARWVMSFLGVVALPSQLTPRDPSIAGGWFHEPRPLNKSRPRRYHVGRQPGRQPCTCKKMLPLSFGYEAVAPHKMPARFTLAAGLRFAHCLPVSFSLQYLHHPHLHSIKQGAQELSFRSPRCFIWTPLVIHQVAGHALWTTPASGLPCLETLQPTVDCPNGHNFL